MLYKAVGTEERTIAIDEGKTLLGNEYTHFKDIINDVQAIHPTLLEKTAAKEIDLLRSKIPEAIMNTIEHSTTEKLLVIPTRHDFLLKHGLGETALAFSGKDIDRLIQSNTALKETAEKFMSKIGGGTKKKIFKIGKLVFVVTLTGVSLATVGSFLHDTARSISGCYKILDSGKMCKIKSNSCSHTNLATNNIFCPTGYTEACDCNTDKDCTVINGSPGRYICYRAKWTDVIQAETQNVVGALGQFIKYISHAAIFFLSFVFLTGVPIIYRLCICIFLTSVTFFIF